MTLPPLKIKQKGHPNRCSTKKVSRENSEVEFQFRKSWNDFESSFNSFYCYGAVKFDQCLLFNITLFFFRFLLQRPMKNLSQC